MSRCSVKNSDKRLKNLKPWKPGQSGNPKGRPSKDECLTSLLKEEITKVHPSDKHGRTWKQLIVIATMKLAIKGNSTALREVWERMDGKLPVLADYNFKLQTEECVEKLQEIFSTPVEGEVKHYDDEQLLRVSKEVKKELKRRKNGK